MTSRNAKCFGRVRPKERPNRVHQPDIPWVKGKAFALGVWFTTDKRNASFQKRRKDSVKVKINVIELSQLWRFTLLGKITLIKSLLVSQLIYAEADLWEFRRWLSFTKIFRCVQFTAYVPSQLSKGFYPDGWWGRLCCLCKIGLTNRRLCGFQNFESRHRYTLKGPVAFLDLSLVISFNFLYCCRRNNKAITGRSFKKSKGDISTFGTAQAKSSLILAKNYSAHRQLYDYQLWHYYL